MPTMTCRECGKDASDSLGACPHCGVTRDEGPTAAMGEPKEARIGFDPDDPVEGLDTAKEKDTAGDTTQPEDDWEDYKPIRGLLLIPVILLYYNTVAFVFILFFTPTHMITSLLYSGFLMVCFYTIHAVHRRLRRAIFLFKVFFGASVVVSSLQGFAALGPADWVSMILAVGFFAYFHRARRVRDTFVE